MQVEDLPPQMRCGKPECRCVVIKATDQSGIPV